MLVSFICALCLHWSLEGLVALKSLGRISQFAMSKLDKPTMKYSAVIVDAMKKCGGDYSGVEAFDLSFEGCEMSGKKCSFYTHPVEAMHEFVITLMRRMWFLL